MEYSRMFFWRPRVKDGLSLIDRRSCGTLLALMLLGGLGGKVLASADPMEQFSHSASVCKKTATYAFIACRFDVRDDQFEARAICGNFSDAGDQTECRAEAEEERAEANALCKAQRSARRQLCQDLGEDNYDQTDFWDPANFVDPTALGILNPYFPLVQGVTEYAGEDETVTVTITDETKLIEGVTCLTVNDVATEEGEIVEDTDDWYAQDVMGNVWYCGEISLNYETFEGDNPADPELVDIDGSWKAFRDGSQPGIIMKAFPMVGDIYRQEWALGEAEDIAEVISVDADGLLEGDECEEDGEEIAEFMYAMCDEDCLVTLEYTPIEPGSEEHKYYAPGQGLLMETDLEGGCVVRSDFDE